MFFSTSTNGNKSLQGNSFMQKANEIHNSGICVSPERTDEIKVPQNQI